MIRFLPLRLIVRRAARAYGIADPTLWLARIRKFSQPSEVQEPIELLRAGIHFHARGLINTKAIQHNLDWVWPYWVQRQFDPADASFLPRAFSFSHINLTHRNWTAVGLPELSLSPIVDPRGLVTPLHDGWSLDFWLTDAGGHQLVPSRVKDDHCKQSRQLTAPNDERIAATVEAILKNHFFQGGFFQDMIHSGINAYLTLDVAQTLLRNGDERYRDLIDAVAELASPTGQWPEAIHPRTLGGCMGDGQHGWAAGEWVMMIRNCFVREERDRLIIGSGLFREWFNQDADLAFGPTHTPWGQLSVRIVTPQSNPMIIIDDHWHAAAPRIDVRVLGFQPMENLKLGSAIPLQRLASDEFRIHEAEVVSILNG